MDKEKVLVPSVISLHVRSTDQNDKESLKNLLNLPEPGNNRKFSYNLVKIYNTGYGNQRSKTHINDSLVPYISNGNPRTNFVSSTVILSRCHTSLKKNHLEYSPINSHFSLSNSNPYWSNGCKNNPNITSPVLNNITSPNCDNEFSKASNPISNSTSLNSNQCPNEFGVPNMSNQNRINTLSLKEDRKQNNVQPDEEKVKVTDVLEINSNKVPSVLSQNSLQSSSVDMTSLKRQLKTSVTSNEKSIPKRSTSSFLIPIKERPTNTGCELNTPRLTRSHTSFSKISTSNQKYTAHSASLNNSDSKKTQSVINNEITPKQSLLSLFQKPQNSKSVFISNSQAFLYPDPYNSDSTGLFMIRLSELAAFVNETVKWEKSRSLRRRCATQMQ